MQEVGKAIGASELLIKQAPTTPACLTSLAADCTDRPSEAASIRFWRNDYLMGMVHGFYDNSQADVCTMLKATVAGHASPQCKGLVKHLMKFDFRAHHALMKQSALSCTRN